MKKEEKTKKKKKKKKEEEKTEKARLFLLPRSWDHPVFVTVH